MHQEPIPTKGQAGGAMRLAMRTASLAASLTVLLAALSGPVAAQETLRIGMILPLTGPFTPIGKQVEQGARLFMAKHGNTVAGKKVELILRDDGNVADTTRRLAQELVVNDKVTYLAGFGLTPLALATAPIATQAKVPMIVMAAATAIITEQSPFIVRTSFTLPQATIPMADWASKNRISKVVTLVSDYGPGIDAENAFKSRFASAGGSLLAELRVPLANPDFAPFLQRARDARPDALFVFVPAGQSAAFGRQFVERGLDKTGIRLIGTGDITDDDVLNQMGDVMLGVVTSHHYSVAHPSPANKAFVDAYTRAYDGRWPNFMGVGGYDGMQLIYKSIEATKGSTDGATLVNAMRGMAWESPRGPVQIDPRTRDIIQNMYVRKVEKKNGKLYNVEFDTIPMVKDPVKEAKR
jgi:branched-chain amino acid transport system substrate-binding protein